MDTPFPRYLKTKVGKAILFYLLVCAALFGAYLISNKPRTFDFSAHSLRQNLIHLNATDVCEMRPMSQFGSQVDQAGHRTSPLMMVYLTSPLGRRPQTGDILEIKYPKELHGRVRFTQETNDGYGGSGRLDWIGTQHDSILRLAVWDFTFSGSLQYRSGDTVLWGDCKKMRDLKT